MKRITRTTSPKDKIVANKLDPGVFVIEVPETGRKISLGQPPDTIKRLQQVGYFGANAVDTFILIDSKLQGESTCWVLVEFPLLYALYLKLVRKNGKTMPAFFAGEYPVLVGLQNDVDQALRMMKYGNYGVDTMDELDAMDLPEQTRDALKKEILGLAVGNEVKETDSYIKTAILDPKPGDYSEFSDLGDGIKIGRTGYNQYRLLYAGDTIDVDACLQPEEKFRAPIAYKQYRFPITDFGIWHTGEYDGMDAYYSAAHTTIIHKYEPILIDYPSNMTDILAHNGLSKQSVNTVIVTHNHDDHTGAMVELFRRNNPCQIITTEPVKNSLVKKIAAQANLSERRVDEGFNWTILPFRADLPYQTETYNLDGLQITGHLSCHSVPTTVYTFRINQSGVDYSYGHFLDIISFKRMQLLIKDSWMPPSHAEYLDQVVRQTPYNLLKYDAGCAMDAGVPFSVHGQWQDLIDSRTEKTARLFSHVNRNLLDKSYEREGRFVRMGDLDASYRDADGQLKHIGNQNRAIIAFFYQAYNMVLNYFESLMDGPIDPEQLKTMRYYAYAFANTQKQVDQNIGTFLIEQDQKSDFVYIIIRGTAEVESIDKKDVLPSTSVVGDGEVIGDIGVIARKPRMATVRSTNRITYLAIPANLFLDAMEALNISYEGHFKEIFERRLFFQSAVDVSRDVSTINLNTIGKHSEIRKVAKGEVIFEKGDSIDSLFIASESVELKFNSSRAINTKGVTLIGEYEPFVQKQDTPLRLHTATALEEMEVLRFSLNTIADIPVIHDNIRLLALDRYRM